MPQDNTIHRILFRPRQYVRPDPIIRRIYVEAEYVTEDYVE
jgi:hypothetical protein